MKETDVLLKPENTVRSSSIELLRIFAMLMIICHHFAVHGHFLSPMTDMSFLNSWRLFMRIGGKVGVDIFILISGYYLINSKKTFDLKKVVKFNLQLLFYSCSIYILFRFLLHKPYAPGAKYNLFPALTNMWWFATSYFILFLIHPFLNVLVHKLSQDSYKKMLILALSLYSLLMTFVPFPIFNHFLWFIILYLLAAYIRLYSWKPRKFFHKLSDSSAYFLCAVISFILMFCINLSILNFASKSNIRHLLEQYNSMESIFIVLISLYLFVAFLNMKIGYKKWINILALPSFGVYLIHDHENFRKAIWKMVGGRQFDDWRIIPYSLGIVIFIYLACAAIELIRIYFLEKIYMKIFDKFLDWLDKQLKTVYLKISDFIFSSDK